MGALIRRSPARGTRPATPSPGHRARSRRHPQAGIARLPDNKFHRGAVSGAAAAWLPRRSCGCRGQPAARCILPVGSCRRSRPRQLPCPASSRHGHDSRARQAPRSATAADVLAGPGCHLWLLRAHLALDWPLAGPARTRRAASCPQGRRGSMVAWRPNWCCWARLARRCRCPAGPGFPLRWSWTAGSSWSIAAAARRPASPTPGSTSPGWTGCSSVTCTPTIPVTWRACCCTRGGPGAPGRAGAAGAGLGAGPGRAGPGR